MSDSRCPRHTRGRKAFAQARQNKTQLSQGHVASSFVELDQRDMARSCHTFLQPDDRSPRSPRSPSSAPSWKNHQEVVSDSAPVATFCSLGLSCNAENPIPSEFRGLDSAMARWTARYTS